MPPDARLVDAPHLQALREPTPALRLVPRHILQQSAPTSLAARLRASAGFGGGAVLVHVALGAAFFFLLSFRDAEAPREVEIPVEVVAEAPKPALKPASAGVGAAAEAGAARGQAGAGPPGPGPGRLNPAKPDPVKPDPAKADPSKAVPPEAEPTRTALASPAALAPATEAKPAPPAPPRPQPAKPAPAQAASKEAAAKEAPAVDPAPAAMRPAAASPPAGTPPAPKLVAPPPEAARAASQAKSDEPANLVPDEHQVAQATREARPAAIPQALTTPDARARSSVLPAARARPEAVERPTPPTTAKSPSQADKLAAVLPMDPTGLPSPFRSVLAGNAAAQINAAYGGVVQGRIRQATVELSAMASAQQLSGAVAVTFTIDDAGGLADLRLVQGSGNAELDDMVLGAIRRLAPFPVPPVEAEHTFNKAFLVGK